MEAAKRRAWFTLDDLRATPAVVKEDGKDFVPTNRWVVFGHHFAAIAGPGPLVGPVLAALTFWQVSTLPRRSTAMLSVLSMPHFWPRLDAGRRLRMELTKLAVLLLTAWTFAAWPVRISWKAKFR